MGVQRSDGASHPDAVRAVLSVLVLAVSLAVLDGWWFGWDAVTQLLPSSVDVAPNTALALIVVSCAVLVRSPRVFLAAGLSVIALAATTLTGYLIDHPGVPGVLVPWVHAEGRSTRMAEATAVALILLGFALVDSARGVTWVGRTAPI